MGLVWQVVDGELEKLKRFRQFLRSEDKEIFDDLLNQCRLYASYGSTMALPMNEIPLLIGRKAAHIAATALMAVAINEG